jgi:hypothetical protein
METLEKSVIRRADQHWDGPRYRMVLEALQKRHPFGLVTDAQVKHDQVEGEDCHPQWLQVGGASEGDAVALLLQRLPEELPCAHIVVKDEHVRAPTGDVLQASSSSPELRCAPTNHLGVYGTRRPCSPGSVVNAAPADIRCFGARGMRSRRPAGVEPVERSTRADPRSALPWCRAW